MQYPGDLMVMQELIWRLQPNFIVETGVAFGGSVLFYASILEIIGGIGQVIGVDKEFRLHTTRAISRSLLRPRIHLIEDDSSSPRAFAKVKSIIGHISNAMVILDSNHTEAHVLKEMELYSQLVGVGGYMIVCDTAIELWADKYPFPDRPWGKGNNPMTAIWKFLESNKNFEIDKEVEMRAGITGHPNGWLRRVR
jgi:cephalosporin hydroxylase